MLDNTLKSKNSVRVDFFILANVRVFGQSIVIPYKFNVLMTFLVVSISLHENSESCPIQHLIFKKVRGASALKNQDRLKQLLLDGSAEDLVVIPQP